MIYDKIIILFLMKSIISIHYYKKNRSDQTINLKFNEFLFNKSK